MTYTHGVPNLRRVDPGIWRGGQPTAEGWAYLHGLGITHVLKLNEDSEGGDAAEVTAGMDVSKYPISTWAQMLGEPNRSIHKAVDSIRPGTFIHCSHGQDRTGLVVACYRLREGWTKEAAEKEMMACGFHPLLLGLYETWREQKPEDWKP